MCLTRVGKVYKGTSRKVRTRYKVFKKSMYKGTELLLPVYAMVGVSFVNTPLHAGVWLDERVYRIKSEEELIVHDNIQYPAGWHVYVSKDEVMALGDILLADDYWKRYWAYYWSKGGLNIVFKDYTVRRIQCRGLLVVGMEGENMVEVYRYIKIEKEE